MACSKISTIKTDSAKKITVEGLSDFQCLEIDEKEEIGSDFQSILGVIEEGSG